MPDPADLATNMRRIVWRHVAPAQTLEHAAIQMGACIDVDESVCRWSLLAVGLRQWPRPTTPVPESDDVMPASMSDRWSITVAADMARSAKA